MSLNDDLEKLVRNEDKYDAGSSPTPSPLRELVDHALKLYDEIEEEDRFPVIHLFQQVDDGYITRVIAPLITGVQPAEVLLHVAQALKESGMPQPDAAFILIDSWGYPRSVYELVENDESDLTSSQKLERLSKFIRPSQHIDRVNISVCQIAFADGHNESAIQTRGDESTRNWLDDREEGVVIKGRIPEAVRILVS